MDRTCFVKVLSWPPNSSLTGDRTIKTFLPGRCVSRIAENKFSKLAFGDP